MPAIIRRDFKDMANLISFQNAYLTAPTEQRKAEIRQQSDNKILVDDDSPLKFKLAEAEA